MRALQPCITFRNVKLYLDLPAYDVQLPNEAQAKVFFLNLQTSSYKTEQKKLGSHKNFLIGF